MKILDVDFLTPEFKVGDKVILSEEIRNLPETWVLDIPEGVLTITAINTTLHFATYMVNDLPYLLHKDWLSKVDDDILYAFLKRRNSLWKEETHARNQSDTSDSNDADLPVCGLQVREELGEVEKEERGVAK